jgi:hypothetical protein
MDKVARAGLTAGSGSMHLRVQHSKRFFHSGFGAKIKTKENVWLPGRRLAAQVHTTKLKKNKRSRQLHDADIVNKNMQTKKSIRERESMGKQSKQQKTQKVRRQQEAVIYVRRDQKGQGGLAGTAKKINRKERRQERRRIREIARMHGNVETDSYAVYSDLLRNSYLEEDLQRAFDTGKTYRLGLRSHFIKGMETISKVNQPPSGEGPKPYNGEGQLRIERIKNLTLKVARHESLQTLMTRRSNNKMTLKGKQERNDPKKIIKGRDQLKEDIRKCKREIREIVGKLTGVRHDVDQAFAWALFFATVKPEDDTIVDQDSFLRCYLYQSLCLAFGTFESVGKIDGIDELVVTSIRSIADLENLLSWKQGGKKKFMMSRIAQLPDYLYEWEMNNYEKLERHLVTDGSSIRYVGPLQHIYTSTGHVKTTEGRTFNSDRNDEFTFKFDGELDWDLNDYKIKDVRLFKKIDNESAERWKKLRPANDTSWVCSYVYFSLLERTAPAAMKFLKRCGFYTVSKNIDNYQKECKRFTAFLKENKDHIETKYGFSVVLLFELEQLTGFRTRHVVPDWKENIEDWVEYKENMNTPLGAYFSYYELQRQINSTRWQTQELEDRLLSTASVFNADGSAKGERLAMGKLHQEEVFVPKMVRLNKTSFNMLQTPTERRKLVFSRRTMYGYPVQKKEITKVRYIINTDIVSHYALAPLESLLAESLKNSDVFNMMSTDQQRQLEKKWLFSRKRKLCADQSSFDHYCSKASFYQLFGYLKDNLKGELKILAELNLNKLSAAACFVVSQDEISRWWSGMLSGWKITSIGDSLINLTQMRYAIAATGDHEYTITVQGDDVNAESDTVHAGKVTTVMNDMGLKQHPDKTISSDRYSEFLRVLSDSQTHERAGYPTRLIPAMIFLKPWSAQYSSKEWSGDSIVQRLKSWRTLASRMRMSFKEHIMIEMCVADCYRSARLPISREAFKTIISEDVLMLKVMQSGYEKKAAGVERGKMFPLEGRVDKKTLKAIIAANLSTQGKMSIRELKGVKQGEEVMRHFKKPIVVMKAPLPQAWLKREIYKQTETDIVRFNMLWGRAWAERTSNYLMWLSKPQLYVHLLKNELSYGSDFTFVLPVSDQTVKPALDSIKATVQMAATIEQLEAQVGEMVRNISWTGTQNLLYDFAKLYV